MKFFADLGERVEARWRAASHDPSAFADIATSALAEASPASNVSADDILR